MKQFLFYCPKFCPINRKDTFKMLICLIFQWNVFKSKLIIVSRIFNSYRWGVNFKPTRHQNDPWVLHFVAEHQATLVFKFHKNIAGGCRPPIGWEVKWRVFIVPLSFVPFYTSWISEICLLIESLSGLSTCRLHLKNHFIHCHPNLPRNNHYHFQLPDKLNKRVNTNDVDNSNKTCHLHKNVFGNLTLPH